MATAIENRTDMLESETVDESRSGTSQQAPLPSRREHQVEAIISFNAGETPPTPTVVKGRNVSGRSWKLRSQKRASSLVNTIKNNQSKPWHERLEQKRLRNQAIALQNELKEDKRKEALLKKERRLENERRRAENEYNNIKKSVQTLNFDTANLKLKSMSKKKLRHIKKTRMNPKTGVIEFVSPFAK